MALHLTASAVGDMPASLANAAYALTAGTVLPLLPYRDSASA